MSKVKVNTISNLSGTFQVPVEEFGYGGSPQLITEDTTISNRDIIYADTSSNAITLTLPAAPNQFDKVTIIDIEGNFSSNPVTINPNGNPIMGSNSNIVLGTSNVKFEIVFVNEWRVIYSSAVYS